MKGWFKIEGTQGGLRNLSDQTVGLEILYRNASGKTVLDLGCAEGLISNWLVCSGASMADGVDCDKERIKVGKEVVHSRVNLHVGDLNNLFSLITLSLKRSYDIVLLLGILHKVERTDELLNYAIRHCGRWLAIRAPSKVLNNYDIFEHIMISGFGVVHEVENVNPDLGGKSWLGLFVRE